MAKSRKYYTDIFGGTQPLFEIGELVNAAYYGNFEDDPVGSIGDIFRIIDVEKGDYTSLATGNRWSVVRYKLQLYKGHGKSNSVWKRDGIVPNPVEADEVRLVDIDGNLLDPSDLIGELSDDDVLGVE